MPRLRPLRSFRLRIALLATCLSGCVLVAFGSWAWFTVRRVSLERLDGRMREGVRREIMRAGGPPRWEETGEALSAAFGGEDGRACFLRVDGYGGHVFYQSDNWPDPLETAGFPLPREEPMLPPGPPGPPPHFGPPGAPHRDGEPHRPPHMRPAPPPLEDYRFFNWEGEWTTWRVGVMGDPRFTLVLGLDLARFDAETRQVGYALLLALPVGLLFIGLGGFLLAQRTLRPVRVIAATAERITARGLDARIALRNEDDEFQRLVNVFNGMLDRLERGFEQATRFSADAAHELKTPLTVLQGQLERGVQEAAPGSNEQARYSQLLEEAQRLKSIIRKLLLLSMADAGRLPLILEDVDLSGMVEEACDDMDVLAPGRIIRRQIEAAVKVSADAALLRQLVQNLAGNAVKYSDSAGTITLVLRRKADHVALTISNTGPGIPEHERARVFERFYRGDKSRGRETDGVGLGLSLGREIARAHGGELLLESTPPGLTAFTLRLPLGRARV